jgi:acetyl-CoA synthetase
VADERTERLAGWLAELGVAPGDGVLLALVDPAVLAEATRAVELLGAVVVPDTDAPGPLIATGAVRHVVAHAADTDWFSEIAGNCTRIAVGPKQVGWAAYPA